MTTETICKTPTHSYKSLRKAVGWIGILLPFVLMMGVVIKTGDPVQPSISDYYYTCMGDVFVGALCAVAMFMFYYAGHDWKDNWLANAAGVFALGVAFFPTAMNCETQPCPTVYRGLAMLPVNIDVPDEAIGDLHLTFASLLFVSFAIFSLFLFTRTEKGKTASGQKKKRNVIFIVCGCVIIASLIAIVLFMQLGRNENSRLIYWSETLALIAFGVSWLTKGELLYPD